MVRGISRFLIGVILSSLPPKYPSSAPNPTPMDFSAWLEVYLGGKWYALDARHNQPRIGRVLGGQQALLDVICKKPK